MLSPAISTTISTSGRARASCEPCRSRKVRCSGEYPVCSKCTASNRGCIYSLQKRAGRPKRPCVIARAPASPAQEDDRGPSPAQSNAARIPTVTEEPPSPHRTNTDIPPYLTDFESFAPAQSHSDILTQTDINASCACLSILYLLLNRLGVRTELIVPDDLATLRNTFERATDVLECSKCPMRFSSVLQNAGILGILCVCIAESYVRLIKTIDARAIEATGKGEKLKVALNPLGQSLTAGDTVLVPIEVSPEQWKSLMYNVVKSEIFGIENHRDKSFLAFIERLEERQTRWHALPTAPDCPPTYQSACSSSDELPLCLTITKAARKVLDPIASTLE
ncbi:hypothetical protein FVEG_09296 [Fusarium verticillioides 7600]|uniref:Zn(2)-C6 fungal-type domain-containing protein n=1 Tax=Gibberella moniliformis (strain M3125 / FGSC 7600) TaxID=334819 RepID=W7MEH0_GIBM7|nr:hypothetical protein FVEG_09296 [Fusarium verticillioides 7600]EWG49948.1 hypothetical protein FVEG_09296 [Fusarium verticillioides 7600]RBQ87553.1 hypothetical protein FVER53263_09296 [Fusarium verticillioides]RBR12442.1 hypothetical protein FVER53590_09296 [Fusarium verticillioides]